MSPGCISIIIFLGFLLLIPLFFAHVMLTALAELGLSPELAVLVLMGIFIGGMINIPVKKIRREQELDADGFHRRGRYFRRNCYRPD